MDLKAIRERAEKATPGPWGYGELWRDEVEITGSIGEVAILRNMNEAQTAVNGMHADAVFIAHARSDIPALLERVRVLEEALQKIANGACMEDVDQYDIGGCNARCEKIAARALSTERMPSDG